VHLDTCTVAQVSNLLYRRASSLLGVRNQFNDGGHQDALNLICSSIPANSPKSALPVLHNGGFAQSFS
jgi:hypothetical protein